MTHSLYRLDHGIKIHLKLKVEVVGNDNINQPQDQKLLEQGMTMRRRIRPITVMPTLDATNLSFLPPSPPLPSVDRKENELEKRASHHSGQFRQQPLFLRKTDALVTRPREERTRREGMGEMVGRAGER